MNYKYDFSREKNSILKEARGIGFSEVIKAIEKGNLIDNINHFNKKKYPNQKIFIVKIKTRVYAVPYVIDRRRKVKFLETIYPSRKLKSKYLK